MDRHIVNIYTYMHIIYICTLGFGDDGTVWCIPE